MKFQRGHSQLVPKYVWLWGKKNCDFPQITRYLTMSCWCFVFSLRTYVSVFVTFMSWTVLFKPNEWMNEWMYISKTVPDRCIRSSFMKGEWIVYAFQWPWVTLCTANHVYVYVISWTAVSCGVTKYSKWARSGYVTPRALKTRFILLPLTWWNLNRLSQFFHWWGHSEHLFICKEDEVRDKLGKLL